MPSSGDESRDRAIVNSHQREYDALAELFLGEGGPGESLSTKNEPQPGDAPDVPQVSDLSFAQTERRERVDAASPSIEVLVLGHLPVLAGAWALAYAGEIAERDRCVVGMLRLTAGRASVDVFGAEHMPQIDSTSNIDSLEEAIALASRCAERWILRVDATEEPQISTSDGVGSVTLLCGADEASTVAAYRTLKSLAAMLDEPGCDDATTPTTLRAAIMGADEDKAQQAANKLSRAADAFLDRPLEIGSPVQRIGGSRPAHLYDGPTDHSAERLLSLLQHALAAHSQDQSAPPEAAHKEAPEIERTEKLGRDEDSTARHPFESPRGDEVSTDETLAAHVEGLRPLPAKCPFERRVELAVDDAGRLNLLTRNGPGAVEALTVVAEWAREHAELLAMASGGVRIDVAAAPIRRLFTDRPAETRRLLDAPIRVHLLAPVQLGTRSGWFCTALN